MRRAKDRLIPFLFLLAMGVGIPSMADEPAKPAVAEKEVRDADELFVKAYNAGDAKALAAMFTDDAEAVDEYGNTIAGRVAIEKVYEALFESRKGSKLTITLDSLRVIGSDLAIETGRSVLTADKAAAPEVSEFSAVLVKRDGKWLQTYVRELPTKVISPKDRLKDLDWLLGDWVDESGSAVVYSTCQRSKDQHFLLRDFTTLVGGKTEMTVHQRIGWDPLTRQFKSWVFDSEGGHGEGLWSRANDQWFVKSTGVLTDGKLASATHVYSIDGKHRVHFRSIDRTVGGEALDDGHEVILVKKPPSPPRSNER